MTREWCSAMSAGVRIALQISPNARKSEVVEAHGEFLKIKLQAPPIDGRANEALIRYLADRLSVPKSAIHITHGQTARKKLVEVGVAMLTVETVRERLQPEKPAR